MRSHWRSFWTETDAETRCMTKIMLRVGRKVRTSGRQTKPNVRTPNDAIAGIRPEVLKSSALFGHLLIFELCSLPLRVIIWLFISCDDWNWEPSIGRWFAGARTIKSMTTSRWLVERSLEWLSSVQRSSRAHPFVKPKKFSSGNDRKMTRRGAEDEEQLRWAG